MTGLRNEQRSCLRQGTGTYARIFISASRFHYSKSLVHMRCAQAWLLPIITFRTGITSVRGTFAQRRPLFSQRRTHERIVAQPHGRELRSRTAPLATSEKALAAALASDLSRSHRACVLCVRVCSRSCAWASARERASSLAYSRPRLLAHACVGVGGRCTAPLHTRARAHPRRGAQVHKYRNPIDKSKEQESQSQHLSTP